MTFSLDSASANEKATLRYALKQFVRDSIVGGIGVSASLVISEALGSLLPAEVAAALVVPSLFVWRAGRAVLLQWLEAQLENRSGVTL